MNKQAPSVGRVLVMVLFALSCFGLLLFLWVSFGGPIPLKPNGYQFKVNIPEATQLGLEADVREAGVPVGKVVKKSLSGGAGNATTATIEMDPKYAPVRSDAKVILRQKPLLGEPSLEMTPGPPTAPAVKDGGFLKASRVKPSVQLDEIFQAFDPVTRQAWRDWQQDLAGAANGRGQDLNNSLGNPPRLRHLGRPADDPARPGERRAAAAHLEHRRDVQRPHAQREPAAQPRHDGRAGVL